jgi:hypothetical protein
MRQVANEVNRFMRYEKGARQLGKQASVSRWADEIIGGIAPLQPRRAGTKWRKFPAW